VPAAIGGTERLFVIDTGSQGSFFTSQYYFEHKNDFASQAIGELDLAGAGGVRTYAAYVTKKLNIKMGGACIQANQIPVITETRGVPDDKFYGNIGQRILGQFKSYTLDFQNMSFSAEGNSCPPAEAQGLVHP
jgi:Aspartyl protease